MCTLSQNLHVYFKTPLCNIDFDLYDIAPNHVNRVKKCIETIYFKQNLNLNHLTNANITFMTELI